MLPFLTLIAMAVIMPREASAQIGMCPRGKIATSVSFKNDRSNVVSYHWVNENCEEVAYGDIQPGAEATVRTYATEAWRIREKSSGRLLQDINAGMLPLKVHVTDVQRAMQDREDDVAGYLVKVLYVLPHDGVDRELDTNGAIVLSIAAMQQWLVQQTTGKRLRFDTYQGALDIAFVRLKRLEAELKKHGSWIRDEIETHLGEMGFNDPRKLYLVYYDGDATECGGGPSKTKPGSVAAIYLQGLRGERNACGKELTANVALPGPNEYGALHEILHGLGFVASCAPNRTIPTTCPNRRQVAGAHVRDDPTDLMYAGCKPWRPSTLDVNRDDYFKHRKPGCLDLNNSAFLEPAGEPPPGWK
jgi:hypothetical protein